MATQSFVTHLESALDGTKLPWLGDTTYHVGFIRQAVRGDGVAPQYGLAVGLQRGFGLSNDVTITPILEYVHLWNNDGTPGQRQHFFTSGVEVTYGPWVGSVSHTLRRTRPQGEGAEETRDTLVQVTGGYNFENGVGLAVGYSFRDEESIGNHTVGALLTYELGIEIPK